MPNNITNVGFSPYGSDLADIERKRAMSQALQQQSMQPDQTQTAGGWAVPNSPLAPLAKALQAGVGAFGQKQADKKQQELGERYQSDYKAMIAKGLRQLQGSAGSPQPAPDLGGGPAQPAQGPDPMAALATFGEHPGGAQFAPLAMQQMQREQLIQALRGGQGGQPAAPAAPQGNPMAPGGGSVMAPGGGAPAAPQGPQMGGPASGIPLETWLQVDPSGKSYLQHLSDQGKSSGRVSYDQQGRAFTVMANGQAQYLPGINARDKPEAVNLGGSTAFVNPYAQGQPLPHSLTPMQAAELPMQQGRYTFETGQQAPGAAAGGGSPGGQPVPLPRPSAPQPALPGPQAAPGQPPLTPKDQAKLNAERAANLPAARQATELQGQDFDRLSTLALELKGHPGLSGSTGMLGMLPSRPGGGAAQSEALITSLKAQVAGMKLQAMRNASKTGGAVGQVTEKEWPRLENMITALDPVKMGEETFKAKLDELVGEIAKSKRSLNDAFKNEYGQQSGGDLSAAEKIELETLRKKHGRR